jgi:hypothetical protein
MTQIVMPPEKTTSAARPWCVAVWVDDKSVDTLYFATEKDAQLFYNAHNEKKK